MKLRTVILIILVFHVQSIIKASISILKYDPLTFQLTFSQNVTLPEFQILVDSNNLPYRVINNAISSVYDIEVTDSYQRYDPDNTQAFSLIFNFPLNVGNGQLFMSNYILSPPKADIFITMGTWPVYLIFTLLLICSSFGIIGISVIDFIQIYILTEIKFHNQTSVVEIYSSLFFFDQTKHQQNIKLYLFSLIRSTVILVAFFLLGLVVKFGSKFIKNRFLSKRIVKFLSYNTFIALWTIALPSVIYKGFQFINDIYNNRLTLTNQQQIVGVIFTYFNFINFITYFYVLYFVLNPKINEDPRKFREYMISSQFELYNKFHRGLHLRDCVKRNTFLFFQIRKLIVVILFFASSNISPWVLAMLLITSFFIFTVRPYKQWFYTNVMIIFNLLWFFFYIVVLEGFFYFDISNTLETRNSLTRYLVSKTVIFHIVCFLGFIASVIQGVRLFKNLRYEFKEELQFKEKGNEILMTRGRLYTQTSEKLGIDMKQSLIFDSPNSPLQRRKKRQPSNSSNGKGKINLFEVEMQQFSPSISDRKLSTRIKKKWKDRSLLEQLATN